MKKTCILYLLFITSVFAIPVSPFTSWANLVSSAPDIVVAKCIPTEVKTGTNDFPAFSNLNINSIEVVLILKGHTKPAASKLHTLGKAYLGQYYLICGECKGDFYQAVEDYRIVPLGDDFNPNDFHGTSAEQIKSIFQWRIDKLNKEIAQAQEEKKRLEDGLKN